MERLADLVAELAELRDVAIAELADELQVHHDLIERRVADALADAEDRAVHAIRAVLQRVDRVRHAEAAIVVPVPVDPDVARAPRGEQVARELDEVAHAVGRDVTDGVAEREPRRARVDRRLEEDREDLGA